MNAAESAASPALAKPQALIVDDSPFLALHLARQLSALGLDAHIVSEGAVRARAAAAAVIFIELELFEANGFQLTRELAETCACPLVLLTGSGRNTDLQWGLRAGASAVLARPVTDAALCAVLDRVLRKRDCAGAC